MPNPDSIASVTAAIRNIDAALLAVGANQSYSIGGRTLTRQSIPDLNAQRTILVRRLKILEAAAGGTRNPRTVQATWR